MNKRQLILKELGWDNDLMQDFENWVIDNRVSKLLLQGLIEIMIESPNRFDYSDPIDYNLGDDILEVIWWKSEEKGYKIWFDGFRFEDWVGDKEHTVHEPTYLNPGNSEMYRESAKDYLKREWINEAYDFIINNWKYAEIEKL